MTDPNRGTGRTTWQIKQAPKGAAFIWCNNHPGYIEMLASKLGRGDLKIYPLSTLREAGPLTGRTFSGIVVDHAAMLTQQQYHALQLLRMRIRDVAETC